MQKEENYRGSVFLLEVPSSFLIPELEVAVVRRKALIAEKERQDLWIAEYGSGFEQPASEDEIDKFHLGFKVEPGKIPEILENESKRIITGLRRLHEKNNLPTEEFEKRLNEMRASGDYPSYIIYTLSQLFKIAIRQKARKRKQSQAKAVMNR
ncbi:hypothetical protein KJA16_01700 [Patescibacteria group bacterium]|nr:hypothetical protein [Patescibacteria group bacterium]